MNMYYYYSCMINAKKKPNFVLFCILIYSEPWYFQQYSTCIVPRAYKEKRKCNSRYF